MCVLSGSVLIIIRIDRIVFRQDEKTARDFGITPGAVLHLVLALRGGH